MVERMRHYIEKTPTLASAKTCRDITLDEMMALCRMKDKAGAIALAFQLWTSKRAQSNIEEPDQIKKAALPDGPTTRTV